jgi:hypothetical protein
MFDSEAGVVRYVPNQNYSPVAFTGIDPTSGLPVYRERVTVTEACTVGATGCIANAGSTTAGTRRVAAGSALTEGAQYSTADLRSRWQARLGFRVTF